MALFWPLESVCDFGPPKICASGPLAPGRYPLPLAPRPNRTPQDVAPAPGAWVLGAGAQLISSDRRPVRCAPWPGESARMRMCACAIYQKALHAACHGRMHTNMVYTCCMYYQPARSHPSSWSSCHSNVKPYCVVLSQTPIRSRSFCGLEVKAGFWHGQLA
jgi:hypothetical protein